MSIHLPKPLFGDEGVVEGRTNFLLGFGELLHIFFDFREDVIEGGIFPSELIQLVLQAHDSRSRIGDRDLVAIQLWKLLLRPEEV